MRQPALVAYRDSAAHFRPASPAAASPAGSGRDLGEVAAGGESGNESLTQANRGTAVAEGAWNDAAVEEGDQLDMNVKFF